MNSCGPILRRNIWSAQAPFRCYQRRWAQVHDVRFVATHQETRQRVLEKYGNKLARKAQEHGLRNVEELKGAYADRIKELKADYARKVKEVEAAYVAGRMNKKANVSGSDAPMKAQPPTSPQQASCSIPYQAPPNPEPQETVLPAPQIPKSKDAIKTLASFIDVEKTAQLPHKEIESIWRLRHVRDPQSVCAVVEAGTFKRMVKTARAHPQFIIPLPRPEQGAEIHFLQWTFPSPNTATVLFTHLAEYKLRGEFAQPHTTVTHHLDLADSNGLVLLEGRVMENRGLTAQEGRWLLMCLQKFYGFEAHSDAAKENALRRKKLMEQFSGGDEEFKVEELVEEAEKVP